MKQTISFDEAVARYRAYCTHRNMIPDQPCQTSSQPAQRGKVWILHNARGPMAVVSAYGVSELESA